MTLACRLCAAASIGLSVLLVSSASAAAVSSAYPGLTRRVQRVTSGLASLLSGCKDPNTGRNSAVMDQGRTTKQTIVLDPGHSGTEPRPAIGGLEVGRTWIIDKSRGILDYDYRNYPEIRQVWDVAISVKAKLQAAGYQVIMTKDRIEQKVTLGERAAKANDAHADLAISIHNDGSQAFSSFAEVWPQQTRLYRTKLDGSRWTFNDSDLADKSMSAARTIVNARRVAEGRPVSLGTADFSNRGKAPDGLPFSTGNIPLVQLFSHVPWVYNEVGGQGFDLKKYATGLTQGIEQSISRE